MRYNNYHKHDHTSNIRTPDVIVKPEHYIERIKELGHTHYFTTNHGCSGNIYEAYGLCKKNNIKCVFGMEMYYVDNRFSKENRNNYHLVVIALNSDGMKDVNRISSEANKTGFYYHPRIDMQLLLSLNPLNVVITTACVHNRINHGDGEPINDFLLPLKNHFKTNLFLEVQSHNHEVQIKWNSEILKLSEKYDIEIIHGCDSHYIYEEQYKDRLEYLNGKGMNYGDENDFVLDYPSYENILDRYKKQGVLSETDAIRAIKNTLIFDLAQDLELKDDVKMPTIYKELTVNQRYNKLMSIVSDSLKEKLKTVPKEKHKEYIEAVKFEMNIIKESNVEWLRIADYFLINERIINKGVNEYGGVLTRTGRGSAVSFEVNHLLGFTEIDRLDAEVPLYPTRFISASRLLESRSLPDIDFNTADPKPFIKASKDVLGEDGCYYMVAYGKMKSSGAFRNLCRARNIPMDDYNEFGKLISEAEAITDKDIRKVKLEELEKDFTWGKTFTESKKFVGVIDSISPSPCSFLLLDTPISEELGLIRINNELCACIDGYTSDVWKFLKNDILTVTVWDIIDKVYKKIDKPIPTIPELRKRLDNTVWDLYANGITATLNQVDSDFATELMKKYKAKTVAETCSFVAAIRPSFAPMLNGYLNRIDYSTGIQPLDKLLESSDHYLLYQENIMSYFTWLGIEEDKTYDLLKLIAKKKMTQEEQDNLETTLRHNWIEIIGNDDDFEESWSVIQRSAMYLFNASHSLSVAWDSLYGAELKAHYPLEYYSVILDIYKDNVDKTAKIYNELDYFGIKIKPIKFRYSNAMYSMDKDGNSIYKGISSIKFLNEKIAEELFLLGKNEYSNFIQLLSDIKEKTSINSRQLQILTILSFFSEFGKTKKLLQLISLFDNIYSRKQIKISDIEKIGISEVILQRYSNTKTEKMYKDIDCIGILNEYESSTKDEGINIKERLSYELDYMGYIEYRSDKLLENVYFVTELKTYKDKTKPYISLYQIRTGNTIKTKITKGQLFLDNPFGEKSIVIINKKSEKPKMKKVGDKWVKSEEEFDIIIEDYDIY